MGFGTVFTVLTFILIFAGMILVVINVQTNLTQSVQEFKAQTDKQREEQEDLTITSSGYATDQLIPWEITYADEFQEGNFTNTSTNADDVTLDLPNTTGTYTSPAYDTGASSNYSTITYTSIEPAFTTLGFQVRSADTYAGLVAATFVGPDTTTSTFYTNGQSINVSHDNERFFQYRAYFTGDGAATPTLQDVTIGVQRAGGHLDITIENTGKTKLRFEETDVYVNGIRITRNESGRVLEEQVATDARLWNPGEDLNITIFGNYSGSTTVQAQNGYGTDTEVLVA